MKDVHLWKFPEGGKKFFSPPVFKFEIARFVIYGGLKKGNVHVPVKKKFALF